ncbi:MAG: MvaI/BcnI restriction endonuclease family protein [Candidatus Gastranaerophilales bacterium]|nr:MvaI/BcnI restriction endonuclease family protein [Candidatus Gastranaerophilales bacterium]
MSKKIYTKESIIEKLKEIREMGWIESGRHGNCGGVGNTLEDLLGIEENNLPLPNAAEWELKCQRLDTTSLITLFHMEPSPTALKFVPCIFLPKYGWEHKYAGEIYPDTEMSFRQTISCLGRSDRGFKVEVNRKEEKILISFDENAVAEKHAKWLESIKLRGCSGELNPQPYWGFQDLYHKAGTKLLNCFFVEAAVKKINGKEHFKYEKIMKLSGFSLQKFLDAIESGYILIDFDARTGHNHGTKFRLRRNKFPELYENIEII